MLCCTRVPVWLWWQEQGGKAELGVLSLRWGEHRWVVVWQQSWTCPRVGALLQTQSVSLIVVAFHGSWDREVSVGQSWVGFLHPRLQLSCMEPGLSWLCLAQRLLWLVLALASCCPDTRVTGSVHILGSHPAPSAARKGEAHVLPCCIAVKHSCNHVNARCEFFS